MLLCDRLTGGAVALLGAASAYGGSLLPPVPGQQVGPSTFPIVVGIGLLACGILIALGVGQSFEEVAEKEVAASDAAKGVAEEAPSGLGLWRAALPPLLLVAYALVVDTLGFVPMAFLMILALSLAFGGKLRLALPLAAIAPVGIQLVFYKLLRVPLPDGLLPMPW